MICRHPVSGRSCLCYRRSVSLRYFRKRLTSSTGRLAVSSRGAATSRLAFCCSSGSKRTQPFLLRRSEEHTSELQSLMRNSSAVFCLNKEHQVRKADHAAAHCIPKDSTQCTDA